MILVTGASGLLGANIVSLAHQQGRDVVGIYHRHPVQIGGPKLLAADLTDEAATSRIFDELQPTSVVHCAAVTDVDWCEAHAEAAHRVNVTTSARIAKLTSRLNARLLYVSTDSVFDGLRGQYREIDQPAPLNIYAQTKLRGEQETLDHHPSAMICRVNVYGWNVQRKNSLAEWILKQLSAGEVVPGFTDTFFCPIFAGNLSEILLAMLDRNLTGLYHVVASERVSKYEFARRVASTFGFDVRQVVPSHIADAKLQAVRPRDTSLNTDKVRAALGRPMPNVDSGLSGFAQSQECARPEFLRSLRAGVQE